MAATEEARARQALHARDMGLTLEQYRALGFDANNTAPAAKQPSDPRSAGQSRYLNDLGVLEPQWPLTRGECNALIQQLEPAFKEFMAAHSGKKPVTGRQRAALRRRGVSIAAIDGMTKEEAGQQLGAAAHDDDVTEAQLSFLNRYGDGSLPSSKAEASAVIAKICQKKNRPSDKQIALIKQFKKDMPDDVIERMTGKQASVMVGALLAAANSGKNKRRRRRKDGDADNDAPDPHDPNCRHPRDFDDSNDGSGHGGGSGGSGSAAASTHGMLLRSSGAY